MSRPQGHRISGESKSESPLLTSALLRYKPEVFAPAEEKNKHEHPHKHYHRNHTQDLRLFCCELSKVA